MNKKNVLNLPLWKQMEQMEKYLEKTKHQTERDQKWYSMYTPKFKLQRRHYP